MLFFFWIALHAEPEKESTKDLEKEAKVAKEKNLWTWLNRDFLKRLKKRKSYFWGNIGLHESGSRFLTLGYSPSKLPLSP